MLRTNISARALSGGLLDVLIRAGLITVLVLFCFQIFHPFLNLMLWAVILAITIYPLHNMLKGKLGNKDGRTATLIIVVALALLMVPIYLLGTSVSDSIEGALAILKSDSLEIPLPNEKIATLPIIGKPLYNFWMQSATDMSSVLMKLMPYIKTVGLTLLGKMAGVGVGFLLFIGALIIAGVLMAYGENGERSAIAIATRLSGPERGPRITELCTATIRAVAQGVVGIAFIQMLLVGVGFVLMGVPGAGLLAMVALLMGIMQLPVILVSLPVIAYVFATEGTTLATIIFGIYSLIAGMADNILKPLMLGRGVDVPMPVILIGALGGMVSGGFIGLFIGPVALAVAYQLFWQWVEDQPHIEVLDELPRDEQPRLEETNEHPPA
ncbi:MULTISPECIES: AI-2E family transporter [Pseudomonas]|uniref:AI-2E family transporter n=1 Tax=Pseudomonas sp. Hg7Tf TaxID=3236988 RepID=A0AB39I7I2_9PSED|nr:MULTISPECIES: AI-2E family transporter [Pseudomonas]KJK07364.1 permease [Pseudomonas sp. 5]MDD1977626.1 AI-2E family transporter [Pseudomonas putida]MDH2561648.1 AI-2E family transporter [Pseudomonas sp. Hg5Tf]QYX48752.1 AI-2E family transporter [Pseudomonas sp. S11A 273]